MQIDRGAGHNFRKKVLIAETGHAASKHLDDCMFGAITNHFGADPALLMRPNTLSEPAFQRQAFGQAPK